MLDALAKIKSLKNLSPAGKGFLSGLTAAVLLSLLLSAGKEKDTQAVLAARKDIQARAEITESMLAVRKIPKRFLPRSVIQPENKGMIVGKTARVALAAGDALRWHDLLAESVASGQLSAEIPKGYRAFSLAIDKAESMKPWLRPGDLVDILGSFHLEKDNKKITRTLFQNVPLLKTQPQLVFLISPQQVELLTFAQGNGSLALSLRNRTDREILTHLPELAFRKFLGAPGRPDTRAVSGKSGGGPQILSLGRKRGLP